MCASRGGCTCRNSSATAAPPSWSCSRSPSARGCCPGPSIGRRWCARATARKATTTQDSGVGSRDTYPADAVPATVAARRADHCADARSLSRPRIPLRLPGEPAEESGPSPSEPRLERGSNERASRPPVHETARRRDRGIKWVGDGSTSAMSQLRKGVPPRGGFAFLNAAVVRN